MIQSGELIVLNKKHTWNLVKWVRLQTVSLYLLTDIVFMDFAPCTEPRLPSLAITPEPYKEIEHVYKMNMMQCAQKKCKL